MKNDLIVRALRYREDYDDSALADSVRARLLALADESADNADRIRAIRRSVRWRWGRSRRHDGYRRADRELLERRQEIEDGLARRLRLLSEDAAHVAGVVSGARDAALDEIAHAVRDRVTALDSTTMVDENYLREREARTRLMLRDLEALERSKGRDGTATAP